jgi:hydrogenase-1 operon protein HyaF
MARPTDAVEFMPMPREMTTFEMPRPPEPGPGADVAGGRDVLQLFVTTPAALAAGRRRAAGAGPGGPAAATLKVINESLGEGEVAAIVDTGDEVRVQETVFSGVWRQQHLQPGRAPAARLPAGRAHAARCVQLLAQRPLQPALRTCRCRPAR